MESQVPHSKNESAKYREFIPPQNMKENAVFEKEITKLPTVRQLFYTSIQFFCGENVGSQGVGEGEVK